MIHNEIFYLFAIISVGYIVGNIKIRGFSLDVTAMLLVALVAGHYGMIISDEFQYFGLAIFLYAIGLQSGPGFFDTIKNEGLRLNIIATVLLLIIFTIIFGYGYFNDISKNITSGIFTGTLASVTGLAAALEIEHSAQVSVIFGLVYPIGIVTTILFIRFLPIIFRVDMPKEVEDYESTQKARYPEIYTRNFRITNENFRNTEIKKSKIESMTQTVIERTTSDNTPEEQNSDILLQFGDIIRVVGTEEQLANISIILGQEVGEDHEFNDNMVVLRLLTTSKDIVGKKIGIIKELRSYRAVITKVRRAGIDIASYPDLTLRLGDKLYVVAPKTYAEKVTNFIGNDLLKYPAADFLPISLGVVFGIILGSIPITLPWIGMIKLSFVGGILIVALVLGRLGRVGPIVWNLSPHSTTLLKTLGQLIFIATLGTNAGKYLVESLENNGIFPVVIAFSTIVFSLSLITLICRKILKMNFLDILGLLSGALTSSPSLTMANNLSKTDYPSIAYAAVYPLGLVLTIVLAQLGMKLM